MVNQIKSILNYLVKSLVVAKPYVKLESVKIGNKKTQKINICSEIKFIQI